VLLILPVTLTLGCTGSGEPVPSASPSFAEPSTDTSSVSLGAPGCRPESPITVGGDGFPEVRGTGQEATLYGLIMATSQRPVFAGEEVKIVWRMTGAGPLRLSLSDAAGTMEPLLWGPTSHGGSTYHRPGDEWGAGYRFPSPGCWRLHAQRTVGSADVWLQVDP